MDELDIHYYDYQIHTTLVTIEFPELDICGHNDTAPKDLYDYQTTITPSVFLVAFHLQWTYVEREMCPLSICDNI